MADRDYVFEAVEHDYLYVQREISSAHARIESYEKAVADLKKDLVRLNEKRDALMKYLGFTE